MSRAAKTNGAKEDSKVALVPRLRFPEFRGDEEWQNASLSTLLMKNPDYGVNAAAVPFTERLPQYLRITDISEDGTYLSDKKVSVDLESTEEIFLDDGDIVLARTGASVGKSYRYRKEDGRLVFAGFLIRVRTNPKRLDSTYLANFLTTDQYWKWVVTTSGRSGQPGINSVEYGSLKIPLPAVFAEQQKIAECLNSVDEVIAAQARNVDALKTHKKGLMQRLFPREGETQPRLRFREFQNDGAWERKKIGSMVLETQRPLRLADETEYRLVTVKRRYGGLVLRGIMKGQEVLVKSQFVVRAGDFLISKRQIVHNACGLVPDDLDGSVVSNEYSVLTPKSDCSIEFFSWFAMQPAVSASFMNCSVGIVIEKMLFKLPAWFKQEFLFPPLEEQHRIASCLSSLDALITAETQKLETLKHHKRALMQQLFPSPEGVEG